MLFYISNIILLIFSLCVLLLSSFQISSPAKWAHVLFYFPGKPLIKVSYNRCQMQGVWIYSQNSADISPGYTLGDLLKFVLDSFSHAIWYYSREFVMEQLTDYSNSWVIAINFHTLFFSFFHGYILVLLQVV